MWRFLLACLLLLVACGPTNPTSKLNGIWVNETNGSEWIFDTEAGTFAMNGSDARIPFRSRRVSDTTIELQVGDGTTNSNHPMNIRFLNNDTIIWADGQPDAMTMTRRR